MREYTKTHEWIEKEANIATIGITQPAVSEVGEIVYVELPKVGKEVKEGEDACVIESTKAAIDIASPVSSTIVAINQKLITDVHLINTLPESEGWLFQVEIKAPTI